jgi:hypothetical protein
LDSNDLTPAADVFALGSSLAYAATGRKPYGEGTLESIYLRLMREDIDLVGVDVVPGGGMPGNGFRGNDVQGNGVPGGGIRPGDAVPPADQGKRPQRLTRIVVAGLVVLVVLAVLAVLGFAVYELNGGAASRAEQAATQLFARPPSTFPEAIRNDGVTLSALSSAQPASAPTSRSGAIPLDAGPGGPRRADPRAHTSPR